MNEIKIDSKNFKNSLAKAVAKKPFVRLGKKDGQYVVNGSQAESRYVVQFQRGAGGKMLGSCLCQAGQKRLGCYHLAAALLAHSAFVRSGLRVAAPLAFALVAAKFGRSSRPALKRGLCAKI